MVILPIYDHRPWPSASLLGLSLGRSGKQTQKILPYVQRFQAGEMSSLLSLQQVRAKHGSSLPLDKQLHRVLEPQILLAASCLRAPYYILRADNSIL
jgi:hypothetical protein